MNKFGEFIVKKREQLGLTARKLAQMLDTSASYLCDIEQGRKKPPFTLEKQSFYNGIIDILKLDSDQINHMYRCVDEDLQDKEDAISPDLVTYLKENSSNMTAFREIKELQPTDDDLKEAIEFLKNKMKLKRLYIKDIDIDKKALEIIKATFPKYLDYPQPIDIELIVEHLGYSLQCVTFYDRSFLGMSAFDDVVVSVIDADTGYPREIVVKENSILFDEKYAEDRETRFRMTLAHELGHMVLHKELHKANKNIMCRAEDVINDFIGKVLRTDHDWEEHQANVFASAILVPYPMAFKIIDDASKNYEIPALNKLIYMSKEEKEKISIKFADTFKVSKQMAGVRLEKILSYILNKQ